MTAYSGENIVLAMSDGQPSEQFIMVAGMQQTRFSVSNRMMSNSDALSDAWRELHAVPGGRSIRISGEGRFEDSDAESWVRSAAFSGTLERFRVTLGNGEYLTGSFLIGRYERVGQYADADRFQLILESSGEVLYSSV